MSHTTMPAVICEFLAATKALDTAALLATFTADAILADVNKEHRGEQIRRWADDLYIGANVSVEVLSASCAEERIELKVLLDGDYEAFGVFEPFVLLWTFALKNGKIKQLTMVEDVAAEPFPTSAESSGPLNLP